MPSKTIVVPYKTPLPVFPGCQNSQNMLPNAHNLSYTHWINRLDGFSQIWCQAPPALPQAFYRRGNVAFAKVPSTGS
jgi:hypothetical protein